MSVDELRVSRELRESLTNYQELLLKWNRTINLISRSSEKDIWCRHILDSLQLIKYIAPEDSVLDIGSGAGFPGMVLSLGGVKKVRLVECDERKVAFLRLSARFSPNEVEIVRSRVDAGFAAHCDILTCRGLGSVDYIFQHIRNITVRKKILLLKGENYDKEVREAKRRWLFNIKLHDSITAPGGKILEIWDVKNLA